jgi:hypothetical protein
MRPARSPEALELGAGSGAFARAECLGCFQLEGVLLKGARAAGFSSDLWTWPRVVQYPSRRFGVGYPVDRTGRLLWLLGWGLPTHQRRTIEGDAERSQRWVKQGVAPHQEGVAAPSVAAVPR